MDTCNSKSKLYKINDRQYTCPFELTASIIASKWKMRLVKILLEHGKMRYGELKKAVTGNITHKMLIQSLRELESDGIVERIMYPEVPPRVEYKLGDKGIELKQVIEELNKFGSKYEVKNII